LHALSAGCGLADFNGHAEIWLLANSLISFLSVLIFVVCFFSLIIIPLLIISVPFFLLSSPSLSLSPAFSLFFYFLLLLFFLFFSHASSFFSLKWRLKTSKSLKELRVTKAACSTAM